MPGFGFGRDCKLLVGLQTRAINQSRAKTSKDGHTDSSLQPNYNLHLVEFVRAESLRLQADFGQQSVAADEGHFQNPEKAAQLG